MRYRVNIDYIDEHEIGVTHAPIYMTYANEMDLLHQFGQDMSPNAKGLVIRDEESGRLFLFNLNHIVRIEVVPLGES